MLNDATPVPAPEGPRSLAAFFDAVEALAEPASPDRDLGGDDP